MRQASKGSGKYTLLNKGARAECRQRSKARPQTLFEHAKTAARVLRSCALLRLRAGPSKAHRPRRLGAGGTDMRTEGRRSAQGSRCRLWAQ